MHCRSCGHTNPARAKFCNECGTRLDDPTGSAPQRTPRDYTPRHLADHILTLHSSLEGERKVVTVLFADVVGSMSLAERVGAEAWHGILDRFFRILGEAIHRHGGTINQFTGDGVMALFGAPIAHEDHAQRACRAALEITAELSRLGAALRTRSGIDFSARMGLNSGEVVVGKIGDDLRMDYTAQGHAVGLASRVERLARPGHVNLTATTADLVAGYFDLADLGEHVLLGSREPVRVYELLGEGPLRTRLEVAETRGLSPFIGRHGTLDALEHAFETGEGLVVGIEGPAGIGKSRLTMEFVQRCRSRGIPVHQAHCPSHGEAVPLLPIRELVRDWIGLSEHEDEEKTRARLGDEPLFHEASGEALLPVALDLLGFAGEGRSSAEHSSAKRASKLVGALLRTRSAPNGAVIWIDDLHWIDAQSAEILAELVETVRDTQTLLILNFRSEFRASWMEASHYRQIGLAALGDQPLDELIEALVGSDPSLASLRARVRDDTGGNPLFVEEWVRALVETGTLEGSDGAYRLVDPDAPLEIPAALQPIVAARIDRLPDAEKEILRMASVIGRRFDAGILERIAERPHEQVADSIAHLAAAGFVLQRSLHPKSPWSFHHGLLRDVAYGSILQDRREQLHAAVARAIEEQGEALGVHASLIAYHLDAANRPHQAARWRLRATLRVTNIQPRRHS